MLASGSSCSPSYLLVFAICMLTVVGLGADLITGLTASIATLGNIGPGLNLVGPMANFAHLHPVSKVVLTGAMWVGRLEVLTVLAILRPEVWMTARWQKTGPVGAAAARVGVPEGRDR